MTTAVVRPVTDNTAKMTYLCRRLAKQKVECPRCKKALQIATLAYSHKCRRSKLVPDHIVQSNIAQMRRSATNNFQIRMATVDVAPDSPGATPNVCTTPQEPYESN